MLRPDASQVVTYRPDGTQPRWLGTMGHVSALRYSFAVPGGCAQLSCNLQVPANFRSDALNPGRIVQVVRGATVVWDGKLLEPIAGQQSWQINASGSGTFGDDFMAEWSGVWANAPDTALGDAIGRGLRWVNNGINGITNLWLGQPTDPASFTITDMLNLVCTKGSLTWYVACRPRGNVLTVFALPTVATRILVCKDPVSRTLGADVNKLWIRYQKTWDVTSSTGTNTPATYGLTSKDDVPGQTAHGNVEEYTDITSAGVYTQTQAQAVADHVLDRYRRISFGDSFTLHYGDLLTTGGYPVDLGAEQAATVCRLMVTDFAYGGEVSPAPVTFMTGAYEYDDDSQSATLTPFQSLRTDFGALLSAALLEVPVRTQPVMKKKKGK